MADCYFLSIVIVFIIVNFVIFWANATPFYGVAVVLAFRWFYALSNWYALTMSSGYLPFPLVWWLSNSSIKLINIFLSLCQMKPHVRYFFLFVCCTTSFLSGLRISFSPLGYFPFVTISTTDWSWSWTLNADGISARLLIFPNILHWTCFLDAECINLSFIGGEK